MTAKNDLKDKPLGLWVATSLVLGNMIGSGIFLLPAVLAKFGGISILGWLLTTAGAMGFALVFSHLSQKYPETGGLYIYCREEFGESIGFLLAWGYWVSLCVGTAAIATTFTSYLSYFIPVLDKSINAALICTLVTLWVLTLINANSVFSGGIMQLVTTIMKVIPILLIAFFGLFKINLDNFMPFNASGLSNTSAVFNTAAITLWAFLGLECASIPAGNIKNPKRTIPLATILGTVIASVIYISTTISIMGLVKPETLQYSSAPFTDAAYVLWGNTGSILIGLGAIIACLGAINGWILIQGQIAFAIAKDGLLPKAFTKTSIHGAPRNSILISSSISSFIILMNYSDGLREMFTFMSELSTIATLIPFLFCAIASILLINRTKTHAHQSKINTLVALGAFIYGVFAVASAEESTVYWCMLLLLFGLPVYAWVKDKN